MVGILSDKLKVKSIHFDSIHGSPTQGYIKCNGWEFYFRFRGSQFKVVIENCPETRNYIYGWNILDRVVFMNYYFDIDNMDINDIVRETSTIFDWTEYSIR